MNKWINLNLIGVGGIPVFGETTCVSLECIYICLQSDGAGWSWQLMFYQKEEFQIVITCSSKFEHVQIQEIWISWRVSTKSYSWLVVSINVICDKYPQIKVWLMVAFGRNGVYYKVDVFAPDSDGKKKLLTVAELHDTLQQIFQWTEGTPLLCNYSSLQLDHCLSKPYLKELCS